MLTHYFSESNQRKTDILYSLLTRSQYVLAENFLDLLIHAKDLKNNVKAQYLSNEIIRFYENSTVFVAVDYREKYTNSLQNLVNTTPSMKEVEHEISCGLEGWVRFSCGSHNELIIYKILYVFWAYHLDNHSVLSFLIQKKIGPQMTTAFDERLKSEVDPIFSAIGLASLSLFRPKPVVQLNQKQENINSIQDLKSYLLLMQKILIHHNFLKIPCSESPGFQGYATRIFEKAIEAGLANSFGQPGNAYSFSPEEQRNALKLFAFVTFDIQTLFFRQLNLVLNDQLKATTGIIDLVFYIVNTALEYNLVKLVSALEAWIIGEEGVESDEKSALISALIEKIACSPYQNEAKELLLDGVFNEITFEEDGGVVTAEVRPAKNPDATFFTFPALFSAKSSSNSANSSRFHSYTKATLLAENKKRGGSSGGKTQESDLSRYAKHQQKSMAGDSKIQIFSGTFAAVFKEKSSRDMSEKSAHKRKSAGNHSGALSKAKKTVGYISASSNAHTESPPKGKITDYFPDFTLTSQAVEILSEKTAMISHVRGFHFYQANAQEKSYYPVMSDEMRSSFKAQIDERVFKNLLSPATSHLKDSDTEDVLLNSLEELRLTHYLHCPSKLHYMQEIYSNTFDRLHRTLDKNEIFPEYPFRQHPFVSFGDDVTHAVRYGFGHKVTGNRFQDRSRALYYPDGSLQNFFVGIVWVTLQPWEQYREAKKFNVLSEYAHGHMRINDRIINERETSFWSKVEKENILLQLPLVLPSFHGHYNPLYRDAFGIDEEAYENFKEQILKYQADNILNTAFDKVETDIVEHIMCHYNKMIKKTIDTALQSSASTLVYHGLDNRPQDKLPSIDVARFLHIYHVNKNEIHRLLDNPNDLQGFQWYSHKLFDCIRFLFSVKVTKGCAELIVCGILGEIRAVADATHNRHLKKLLDFSDDPNHGPLLLTLFKAYERQEFEKIAEYLEENKKVVQCLYELPVAATELFLDIVGNKFASVSVFRFIISLNKKLSTSFKILAKEFAQLLSKASVIKHHSPEMKKKDILEKLSQCILDRGYVVSADRTEQTTVAPASLIEVINEVHVKGQRKLSQAVNDDNQEIIKSHIDFINVEFSLQNPSKELDLSECTNARPGDNILHLAVRIGNVSTVEVIGKKVGSRVSTNRDGLTPLHLACSLGRLDLFKAVYINSMTLDECHLEYVVNSPENDEDKCRFISYLFEMGIGFGGERSQQMIGAATGVVKSMLQCIKSFINEIDVYIQAAAQIKRNLRLLNDIRSDPTYTNGMRKIITLILSKQQMNLVRAENNRVINSRLLDLNEAGMSKESISSIITRTYLEFTHRGRVTLSMAAVIMGDLNLLEVLGAEYVINFTVLPSHRKTVNHNELKQPIALAIEFSRRNIVEFFVGSNFDMLNYKNKRNQNLIDMAKMYINHYHGLFDLFSRNELLQNNHADFYQELSNSYRDLDKTKYVLENISGSCQASSSLLAGSVFSSDPKITAQFDCNGSAAPTSALYNHHK